MAGRGAKLSRLVLLTGATGVDVGAVLSFASKRFTGVATVKFEEYVEEEFKAPIYHAVELLLVDRKRASEKFLRAARRLVDYVSSYEHALVAVHATYHRRRHIVPNPALRTLVSAAEKTVVISYVEDYYHALYRLARRAMEGRTPSIARGQVLDPIGYLYWRAADHSILEVCEEMGAEVMVYANKHSMEGHARLLAYALGLEYRGVARFRKAYISHPITKVKQRAAREGTPLDQHPDVRDIEEFKRRLEDACRDMIVFSPTTIDELIVDSEGRLKTRIERGDRWPHPPDTIHQDYVYPIDLSDRMFDDYLYPVEETIRNPGYMHVVRSLIEAQVESRDLSYVGQADMVIAYRPTMYQETHSGVETEIKTATAQAKPVYAVIPEEEWKRDYTLFRFEYPLTSIEELLSLLHCS